MKLYSYLYFIIYQIIFFRFRHISNYIFSDRMPNHIYFFSIFYIFHYINKLYILLLFFYILNYIYILYYFKNKFLLIKYLIKKILLYNLIRKYIKNTKL